MGFQTDFKKKSGIATTNETEVGEFTVPPGVSYIIAVWSNYLGTPEANTSLHFFYLL